MSPPSQGRYSLATVGPLAGIQSDPEIRETMLSELNISCLGDFQSFGLDKDKRQETNTISSHEKCHRTKMYVLVKGHVCIYELGGG